MGNFEMKIMNVKVPVLQWQYTLYLLMMNLYPKVPANDPCKDRNTLTQFTYNLVMAMSGRIGCEIYSLLRKQILLARSLDEIYKTLYENMNSIKTHNSILAKDCQNVLRKTQEQFMEVQSDCNNIRAAYEERSSLLQISTPTEFPTQLSKAAAQAIVNHMLDLKLLLNKYDIQHINAAHLDDIGTNITRMQKEEKDRHFKPNILVGVMQWMEATLSYILTMEQRIMEVGSMTTMLVNQQLCKSDVDGAVAAC
jgi:hypothetical protein